MIRFKHRLSMSLAVLVLLSLMIGAAEPNENATVLRFEVSSAPFKFVLPPRELEGPQPPGTSFLSWKPPYAVGIPLDGPTTYLPFVEDREDRGFHEAVEHSEKLSPRQKEFLEATRWVYESKSLFKLRRSQDPNRPREVVLYALTLEDAKEMAQIYVDVAVNGFDDWVQFQAKRLKEHEGFVGSFQTKMQEFEVSVQGAQASIVEIQKRVGYRTVQEATAAIAELDRMRNAAEVDIAGIQAKIAAIQRWQGEAPGTMVLDRLKAMFVEESIALEAAEARKTMAMQLRGDANKFVDARQIVDNAGEEKQRLMDQIETNKNNADGTREWLDRSGKLRPRIKDRTITIYQAEWAAATTGN
ncbi:MAG TPA: hypothetical protein VLI39_20300 [Sedimentisphaerales bacterium]|nr:hypothetical protein [Sedimentisphaerales bacterium]